MNPLAVKCKTGIATPRGGTVAHRTAQVTARLIDGRLRYAATWQCDRSIWREDVIILASETSHGGPVCYGCDPEEPAVYRCFSAAGELLYVGSTYRRRQRMQAHSRTSAWWPEVAYVEYQEFLDMADAIVAERIAIRDENPTRNKAGRPRTASP